MQRIETNVTRGTDRGAVALAVWTGAAWLGAIAVAVALLAGLSLLVLEPGKGSSAEQALGVTAAVSGIAGGVLFGAAAVIAQMFGLWAQFPTRVRVGVFVLLVAGFVYSVVRPLV